MRKREIFQRLFACICLIFCCCMNLTLMEETYKLRKEYDICNPNMPSIVPPMAYLEKPLMSTELYIKWKDRPFAQCNMYFKTCSNCHLTVHAKDPSFKGCSYLAQISPHYDGHCNARCPYFYLMDDDYKNKTTKVVRSSRDIGNYSSETSSLSIVACGNFSTRFEDLTETRFLIVSREKVKTFRESSFEKDIVISSPFFPSPCIQNGEFYTYHFYMGKQKEGFITVVFDDWILSPFSEIKFTGANIKGVIKARPYIISDNNNSMSMSFFTGHFRIPGTYFSYPGFMAHVKWYKDRAEIPNIETDCGKIIEDNIGDIQTREMSSFGYKDCIWVVKKPFHYAVVHLVKVVLGRNLDVSKSSILEVRRGLTSVGQLIIKTVASNYHEMTIGVHLNLTSVDGFYIRLKGSISPDSLMISYASYKYNCRENQREFKCKNLRCIDQSLLCDGYDNCGDQSDESAATCDPQHHIPQSSHNSHAGIIIPLVVSLVVIVVFCIFILMLRRCRQLQPDQVQHPRRQNVRMCVTVTSGEHPPSYNDVVRTTPLSNISMAFTWSQGDQCGVQPPSYEEAIEADNFDLSSSARPVGLGFDTNTGSLSRPSGSSVTSTTLLTSLHSSNYDSTSSSSDDNEDNHIRSGHSESSTDDDSLFAQAFVLGDQNSLCANQAVSFIPERSNARTAERRRHGGRSQIGNEETGNRENGVRRDERNTPVDTECYVRSGYRERDGRDTLRRDLHYGRTPSGEDEHGNECRQQNEESPNENNGDHDHANYRTESSNFLQADGQRRNVGRTQKLDQDEATLSRHENDRGVDNGLSSRYQRYNPRTETHVGTGDGDDISNATPLIVGDVSRLSGGFEDQESLPLELEGLGVKSTFV